MGKFKIRKATDAELKCMKHIVLQTLSQMSINDAFDVESRSELNTAIKCAGSLQMKIKTRKLNTGGWIIVRIQ